MSLLENKKLKKAAGLLNSEAPDDHFLAYITADERDMLVNAGGVKTPTKSGVFAYPGHHGSSGSSMGVQQGSSNNNNQGSDQGHSRFEVGSGYYGEPVTKTTPKNNNDDPIPSQPEVPIIYTEPGFGVDEGYDKTNLADPPESKVKTFFNDVKDYVMSGGAIGQAFDKFGKPIQKKMMTYSLEKRIDKISNAKDFSPGAYGYKIQDLQKDLQGVKDGTFTQNDFTKKYGSGDVTNPNDKFYNPDALRENDIADIETYFAPELADIIGGTAPQESMVNEYFANTNNQNLGISSDYMTTYNKAKEDLAKTLNMTANADQFGYSGTMTASNIYYNYLKEQGLL